jgi:hypothetical protein
MHITNQCQSRNICPKKKEKEKEKESKPMTMPNMQPAKQPESNDVNSTLERCKEVKYYRRREQEPLER